MKGPQTLNPVFFYNNIPPLQKVLRVGGLPIKQALVFCDKRFKSHPSLNRWRQSSIKFYYLSPGEKSKSLENLPSHIKKILSLNRDFDRSSLLFISFGGGSIIDLTGFLALIYKRGLPVIHFPTTWLSAIDSAHGGKTAINFQNTKNLLGGWHFPQAVFIVKSLLKQNPPHLIESARAELLKIAFIEGGRFYKKLKADSFMGIEHFIPLAIQAKMKIVRQDPFEKQGLRAKLNLGHTVGHVLESLCPKLSHGSAVLRGLIFSLNWSFQKKFISKKFFEEMRTLIPSVSTPKINRSLFKKQLEQDKKHRENHRLDFVFIKKPGDVFIKSVKESELLEEAKRQNLLL